ncbi:transposase [Acetobacter persici]|uniref:transposase n=1 Tax=Acetobacter persici TaxID=1076596 RepID=UPI001BAA685B|nr:transposase [Acetobacter persici]
MKWKTFTPNQAAVLWLMREHGPAVFRDGFRRLSWAVKPGEGLTIDGPSLIRDALLARGLIAASATGHELTALGRQAAPSQKGIPQRVAETRLQLDPVWLTDEQMQAVSEWFPRSHGKPRLDDRAILSGIVMVLRENLMWQQAPAVFGGEMALRRRWNQWGAAGVLDAVFGHLFEPTCNGPRLVITDTMLTNNTSGRRAVALGWFETIISAEEMEAA